MSKEKKEQIEQEEKASEVTDQDLENAAGGTPTQTQVKPCKPPSPSAGWVGKGPSPC